MTLPRAIYPGSFLFMTRNCTQRQFLLRPDREANNAFIYCLAVAAQRYEMTVLDFTQMSNHLHDEVFDRHGNGPAFNEHFHKLLAKCLNVYRGRQENFFSSAQPSVVRLETVEAVIDKLVYTATNPVKDGLVARVRDWPGANGYEALQNGRALHATRPRFFFAEDGDMPEEVTLELSIPPELGDRDEILAEVRSRVEAVERDEARKRKRVLGRYAVLRQSWRDSPTSRLPRRGLRPKFAAKNLWALVEAVQRDRDFIREHRAARLALKAGKPIPFPYGTYGIHRYMGVAVTAPEKLS